MPVKTATTSARALEIAPSCDWLELGVVAVLRAAGP